MDFSALLYTTPDLLAAEAINVIAAIAMYHLLAKKKRVGWMFYLVSSIALIYLLAFKDSWMSVVNQSMMGVLAIKNYFLFDRPNHKLHKWGNGVTLVVFGCSFVFITGWDGKSISEVLLWSAIITKTLLLGKRKVGGWYFQILQQLLSIVFGLYRDIYLYILKGIFFALQGIWGLLKWKKVL